jgi:tetratricopeptide (TPR) repeat protein
VRKDYEEAIKFFNQIVALDPSELDFWECAVNCHEKLGNFKKAKEWTEKGSRLKAND